MDAQTISVPALVRIKPAALERVGVYLARARQREVVLMHSSGLVPELIRRVEASFAEQGVSVGLKAEVTEASFEHAAGHFARLRGESQAIVGLGGGKALDTAKYLAFLADRPYYAVPTSLSNDGFCSPRSSLLLDGRRRSLPARLPVGVVVDTEVCLHAPMSLWWSGVGDLVAKITAVRDWKIAFHAQGEPVNDLAALLSDSTVRQFIARPHRDLEGMRLLATSLMLNGIAMEIGGTSRPASGSERLVSHALDEISARPRLHGLQVGMASYLMAQLQEQDADQIGHVLDHTRFWEGIRADPFSQSEWLEAVRLAPSIKPDRYTVLSQRDYRPQISRLIEHDRRLAGCFVA